MKKIFLVIAIIVALSPAELLAAPNNVAKLAITLLTGAAAADAAANASEAKAVYQEKDAVVEKLKTQGIDPTDAQSIQHIFNWIKCFCNLLGEVDWLAKYFC